MTEDEKRKIAAEFVGDLVIRFLEQAMSAAPPPGEPSKTEIDEEKRRILLTKIESDRMYPVADVLGILDVSKTTFYRWRAAGFFPEPDELKGDRSVWFGETLVNWLEWRQEFELSCPSKMTPETPAFLDWA